MTQYKTCTKCGQPKDIDSYSKHNGAKASTSGYRASCKSCDVEYNRRYRAQNRDKVNAAKRQWVANNKDKKADQDRRYRQANKDSIKERINNWIAENKDHHYAQKKSYRLENKESKASTDRAWAQANKDKVNAISRRWRKRNPQKAAEVAKRSQAKRPQRSREKAARRRALVRQNGVYQVQYQELTRLLSKPCSYCGEPSKHIDHIIPISRGGSHSIGNLTGACAACNLSKGAKFITEWKKGRNED